jgi:hypothetical protein
VTRSVVSRSDDGASPDEQSAPTDDHRSMSAAPEPLTVRASGPESLDRVEVVALDAIGSVVGHATLSRLYGSRAELELALAPTTTVALALVDAMEREAHARGLSRLELDATAPSERVLAALRRWRAVSDERRGRRPYLTWPTTPRANS